MGLNKSKGNMYEFVTHTWNAIKGECPHGCTYCYMTRWGEQNPVHLDRKEFKTNLGRGNFIFVGSSCDMFAEDIPDNWIDETLDHCEKFDNRYLFQSKYPQNFLVFLRHNMPQVICTTIETNRWYPDIMVESPRPEDRADSMSVLKGLSRFVTIEPILDFDLEPMVELIKRCEPEQVNIGADSGKNSLPEPSFEKVLELIGKLEEFTIISKKKNLARLEKK